MHSDQATIRTRYRRMGDYLQATSIIYDPVMMTDAVIRSTMMWVLDPAHATYRRIRARKRPRPRCRAGSSRTSSPGRARFRPRQRPDRSASARRTNRQRRSGNDAIRIIAKIRMMPKPPKVMTGAGEVEIDVRGQGAEGEGQEGADASCQVRCSPPGSPHCC